jgi:Mg2+/citrate symporter
MSGEERQIIEEAYKESIKDIFKKFISYMLIGWIALMALAFRVAYSLDKRTTNLEYKQIECEKRLDDVTLLMKSINDQLTVIASKK